MGGIVGLRDVLVVAPAATFHHQHPHHQESYYSAGGTTEHPIIPLLSTAPCLMGEDPHNPRGKSSGIHLWQHQHHHPPPQNPNPNPYLKKPMPMLESATGILSSGIGTATCQDCGNQAKKDCIHRRCRTCCKSRGYDCTTHVKSTWVPAARRRERQVSAPGGGGAPAANSSVSTSAPKKPRLLSSQTTTSHTSTSNNTATRSYDTSSSHRDGRFRESLPGQVRAPAVFKCVRVSSMDDDGEDEYAYQAVVKIGGHVFKGFLYDQGADDGRGDHSPVAAPAADAAANNNAGAVPSLSELHLGGAGASAGGGGRSDSGTAAMLTSDIYGGGGGGGLLGGGDQQLHWNLHPIGTNSFLQQSYYKTSHCMW
ncbi:putative protein LATERAL ROOT PRIMORDIUM 1 [Iris pallida]|uniref:Uncharacterized protein n=1 Tax=Iris pallida TaxID=29817 RepID=A0AAX6FQU9_IRIPA|nr:putative protein LATERAL ROOT PRIMORDIUM 1 [Iris pallida]